MFHVEHLELLHCDQAGYPVREGHPDLDYLGPGKALCLKALELVVHARAFHGQKHAAGPDVGERDGREDLHLGKGAGYDAVEAVGEPVDEVRGLCPAGNGLNAGKAEGPGNMPYEVDLLFNRIKEGELEIRPYYLERQARKAATSAHIEDGSYPGKEAKGGDGIKEVLDNYIFFVLYGREVYLFIAGLELPQIGQEGLYPALVKGYAELKGAFLEQIDF